MSPPPKPAIWRIGGASLVQFATVGADQDPQARRERVPMLPKRRIMGSIPRGDLGGGGPS